MSGKIMYVCKNDVAQLDNTRKQAWQGEEGLTGTGWAAAALNKTGKYFQEDNEHLRVTR